MKSSKDRNNEVENAKHRFEAGYDFMSKGRNQDAYERFKRPVFAHLNGKVK